jgi:hypothetical protein
MVCYAVPTAVAVLSILFRRKLNLNAKYAEWFTLLFSGGAIFGVVDHLWNGELFLIGKNIGSDILLGFTITATLFAVWLVMVKLDAAKNTSSAKA